jgi:hypothetical protein
MATEHVYTVEKVAATSVEADKIDETFRSGGIGMFTPPFFAFGGVAL